MPTYLPSKDSEEAQEICNLYPTASREKMNEWRVKYGYKTVISLREAIRTQYQIFRQRNIPELEAEEIRKEALVINLPPVKVNLYKGGRQKKGDEEEMVVIDSDGHAGKLTNSYNKEIYRKRMETKFNSIVTIVNLHRKMYPIKKLHILALGDHIQGENVHQGSKLEEVEMGARNQLIKIAVPVWNDYLASLRQHFTEIIIEGFPGNHGAYDRLAPATSNWDFLLYDILEQGICQKVKNLTMNIHDDPSGMGIVNIMGFRMLCFHGDAVRSTQGVPYFALQRRIKEWYMQFGGFNYAFCLPPNASIWRPDGGTSKIKDIKVGAKLIGANGKTVTVQRVFINYFKGDMVRLKVRGLPWDFDMTPEHRLLKGRNWVEAKNIQVGDRLQFTPNRVFHKYSLSDDWYKLLGTYLAEGSVTKYHLSFGFHEKEDDFIRETQSILQSLYGKGGAVYHDKKRHSKHLRVCSKEIAAELNKACGHYAWEKKLELKYMQAPLAKQSLILNNWLKGDGYKIPERNIYKGYTTSSILARQMLMIAWRLGYHASMQIRPAKPGHRESFGVYIPFTAKEKSKWKATKGLCFTVDSIERYYYDGDTYNLMVSHKAKDKPCYVLNGMKVHNCAHFHKLAYDEIGAGVEMYMNSTLVSDDPWALKKLGVSSRPRQWALGFHPRMGISWAYRLIVDKAEFQKVVRGEKSNE